MNRFQLAFTLVPVDRVEGARCDFDLDLAWTWLRDGLVDDLGDFRSTVGCVCDSLHCDERDPGTGAAVGVAL